MTKSRAYRTHCRQCRRPRDEVGRPRGDHRVLSYSGLCPTCAFANMQSQQDEAAAPSADWWKNYREGVAASIGASIEPPAVEGS